MASIKSHQLFQAVTPEDHNALHGIYRHRCLTDAQLAKHFYGELDDGTNDYTLMRINELINNDLVEPNEYKPGCWVYYLTQRGVRYVRDTSDRVCYTKNEHNGRRKYEATAGTLRMKDRILDHQSKLNDLALEIIQTCGLSPECYRDNFFATNFTYAQPDGVFELPNFHIFLEMDMGNEDSVILRGKWDHYRTYFLSRDYQLHRQKRIIVLFATENVKKLAGRRKIVLRSITDTSMDLLGPMFDCYIGNSAEMVDVAHELITGQCSCFDQAKEQLREYGAVPVDAVPDFVQTGEWLYLSQNGQSWLLLNGFRRPMSLIKRIAYWHQSKAKLEQTFYSGLRLLILAPGEDEICRDLFHAGVIKGLDPNVCFITLDRLKQMPFHKAIFLFDQLGNRYSFKDPDLKELSYEKRQYRPYENKTRRGGFK